MSLMSSSSISYRLLTSTSFVPPTNMAILYQRSVVSSSYIAKAFSNSLFCLVVHLELGEESVFDAIATKARREYEMGKDEVILHLKANNT
ncbi:hypothetical protein Ahy_B05g079360 isoform B [Arachis hypogaea]|uniref:Uncharacterized protein n=1 Tax=Arachis hypogaea TaxID=3818 RepID=A0A444Z9M9_ARAHY|nr:hypothetical protein Ahy_B05g079360 isoform B [Arachis hypogaea]